MSIQDTFDEVESPAFAARLTPTTVTRLFTAVARQQPEVRRLSRDASANHKDKAAILQRIALLAGRDVDLRYEHRWDVPLACYLLALHDVDEATFRVAVRLTSRVPNVWWTQHVAQHLADPANKQTTDRRIPLCRGGVVFENTRSDLIENVFAPVIDCAVWLPDKTSQVNLASGMDATQIPGVLWHSFRTDSRASETEEMVA